MYALRGWCIRISAEMRFCRAEVLYVYFVNAEGYDGFDGNE